MAERFPRYDHETSHHIQRFLRGEYGTDVHPELISLAYSFDRMMASTAIRNTLKLESGVVLADRFTASNLGHNGSKLDSQAERLDFFEFQRHFEHEVMGVPKPDLNLIIMIDPETAQRNVDKKAAREYTNQQRDIHEADTEHLRRTYDTYNLLAETYPDEFRIIDGIDSETGWMRSVESIQADIRQHVKPLLDAMLDQPNVH